MSTTADPSSDSSTRSSYSYLLDEAERLARRKHQHGQRNASALPESHNPK